MALHYIGNINAKRGMESEETGIHIEKFTIVTTQFRLAFWGGIFLCALFAALSIFFCIMWLTK